MANAYERLRHEEDDSLCDSMDAPPFALVDEGEQMSAQKNVPCPLSLTTPTKDLMDSGVLDQKVDIVSSPTAWSSITAGTEQTAQMGSSTMSFAQDQQSSLHCTPQESASSIEFETAASLLVSSSVMMNHSLQQTQQSLEASTGAAPPETEPATSESLGFTQLMWEADNRNEIIIPQQQQQQRMPTLPEDHEMESSDEPPASSLSVGSTISQVVSSLEMPAAPRWPLASTVASHDIETEQLDSDSFQVNLKLSSSFSVQDVMDVIGNPDLLRLWCEPVESLVVTKSSEGARSETMRRDDGGDRQYDGEWIEATTSALKSPNHSNCLYTVGRAMWTSLGFPTYGKVTVFVERQRGQVGLTMGPFGGDTTVYHTINVVERDDCVMVTDRVRLGKDEQYSSIECCCGVCSMIQNYLMPKLEGHKDQAVASMMRLRFLMERGDTREASLPGPHLTGDVVMQEFGERNGVSMEPLLC